MDKSHVSRHKLKKKYFLKLLRDFFYSYFLFLRDKKNQIIYSLLLTFTYIVSKTSKVNKKKIHNTFVIKCGKS